MHINHLQACAPREHTAGYATKQMGKNIKKSLNSRRRSEGEGVRFDVISA
ncbi:hypothetical protein IAE37_002219 [Pseudomonas sp. S31]|nr:hypothetical protein [Pseudomonas sp. S31]